MRPSSRPPPGPGCSPPTGYPATARTATTRRNPPGCTLSRTSPALYSLAFAGRKSRLLPLLFREHALEELADSALGKLITKFNERRHLVRGEVVLAVSDEILLRQRAALLLHRENLHCFSPVFVGCADGHYLDDLGVLVEHLFDLPRIDLEAARVDDLFLAVNDVEVAVVVHPGDVAGVEPAISQGLRGLLGHVPVALHPLRTLYDELARLADWHFALPRFDVHDAHVGAGYRHADAPTHRSPEVGVEADRRALGETVALPDGTSGAPLERAEQTERNAGAARGV